MSLFARCQRLVAQVAVALVLTLSLPLGAVQAALVSTDAVIAETFPASAERTRVEAFLGREDVRQQLAALGVDPTEAAARVMALDDAEIDRIAGQLDQLPAGEGFFATAAIIAGVILLILVITDIAGITNVFTFIR